MPDLDTPPAFLPERLVGSTLDGRYLLNAHLATGGMGAVFRATHVYMRKDVAIKILRPDLTSSSELVERFRLEAEIAASLDHPNIVRVSDFGRSPEGYLFLVMELLRGESLYERIRREGPLPPDEAVPILVQVCHALEAAHARGVVHRDLKPENVFLARNARGGETAKILDFGIAKLADPATVSTTQAGMVVGTPEYLAPEQALGNVVDARADLYAVGLIAWRTLVGHHPFSAEDARGLLMMQAMRPVPSLVDGRPGLAEFPALVAAVAHACEKDVARRPASATALAAELADALGPSYIPLATDPPARFRTPAPRPSSRFVPYLPAADAGAAPTAPFPSKAAAPTPPPPRPTARGARIATGAIAGILVAAAVAFGLAGPPGERAPTAKAPPAAPAPAPPQARATHTARPPAAKPSATLVAELGDPRCEVRRAAARRLGEIGDASALPALDALASRPADPDAFHGLAPPELACGAEEAAAAARRIESRRAANRAR